MSPLPLGMLLSSRLCHEGTCTWAFYCLHYSIVYTRQFGPCQSASWFRDPNGNFFTVNLNCSGKRGSNPAGFPLGQSESAIVILYILHSDGY